MSRLTLVHYRSGIATQCSLDCVCQNGIWLVPCTDPICEQNTIAYIKGNRPPNYPMPAIPMKVGITPTMVWVMPIGNAGALDVWFKLVAWKYRKSVAVNQQI